MKHLRHIKCIRAFYILFLLFGAYTAQFSHTAEVVIGQVCWYTLDTLLKLWTSGLATDFCYRMQEFKKRDVALRECIAYLETQHATKAALPDVVHHSSDPHCDNPYTETETAYVETTVNASPLVNDNEFSTTLTGTTTPLPYTTDLIINGTNAAEQFLKPGERFDPDMGTCTTYYHDNYGNLGLKTEAGNSNVRMVTNAASIFNFIKAVGDWLCKADDDIQSPEMEQYYVPYKNTPEQKETIHQYCLRRLKQKLITQAPTWNDAYLNRRVEILKGWRVGQEKALKKYNSYLAIAETTERIQHFTDAKRSAEQYIESFDAELEAIRAEQAARLQKQNASKNTGTAYADNNTTSPGGKDPKDKEKKERYKGPKYANMNEIFKQEKIGKRLQECSERIEGEKFKGAQVYRVKKDMPELGLYENDVFYLDSYHGDHIEAFKGNREGTPRNVLSVDGRSLLEKLAKAIEDGRTYKPFK